MTYYVVVIVDLCTYDVVYKSRPTKSKVKAQKIFDKKVDGDGEDLNPPNGFLPFLIPITIPSKEVESYSFDEYRKKFPPPKGRRNNERSR